MVWEDFALWLKSGCPVENEPGLKLIAILVELIGVGVFLLVKLIQRRMA